MATQALYRKWRSTTFKEVIGQDHVTRTLENALVNNRIVHAYLFTGPRGTGKTTTARLLAKAVNCVGETADKPCGECRICVAADEGRLLDLIEIDAASNRGIDEIRDLRDKVNFHPGEARFKFYIIDEVHMLTTPAFNALLKTLEEPPPHVMFVLATTEPQQIPPTILSRCQRFDFRRIPLSLIVERLTHIAGAEGISIEPTAVEFISRQAGGSLRDAISLLDQLTAFGNDTITVDLVQVILGTSTSECVAELVDKVIGKDIPAGLSLINQVASEGAGPRQFTRDVVEYFRRMLLVKMGDGAAMLRAAMSETEIAAIQAQAGKIDPARLLRTIRLFNAATHEMKTGFLPQLPLELAFIEACQDQPPPAAQGALPPVVKQSQVTKPSVAPARDRPAQPAPTSAAVAASVQPATAPAPGPSPATTASTPGAEPEGNAAAREAQGAHGFDLGGRWWQDALADVYRTDRPVHGLLNSVNLVGVEGTTVFVEAASDIIRERLEMPKAKSLAENSLSRVMGVPARLRVVVQGQYQRSNRPASVPQQPSQPDAASAAPREPSQGAQLAQSGAIRTAADGPDGAPAPNGMSDAPPTATRSEAHINPMLDEGLKLGGVINNLDS